MADDPALVPVDQAVGLAGIADDVEPLPSLPVPWTVPRFSTRFPSPSTLMPRPSSPEAVMMPSFEIVLPLPISRMPSAVYPLVLMVPLLAIVAFSA
jgi:hypothetical protein